MIDSSLTAQERRAVKQIEAASRSPRAKASRRKPVPKPTVEESQASFAKYLERTNPKNPR